MIISLADMKAYLGIESTDTDNDDVIEDMINACGTMFDNEVNRKLEAQTYTIYMDGTGTQSIFVPSYPIISITSVNIDSDRVFGSDTLVNSGDYVFYPDTGEICFFKADYPVRHTSFSRGRQNVKVVYVGGYTFSGTSITLPYDQRKAAKDQIKFKFKKWQDGTEGISSYSTLNNNQTLVESTDILPMVTRVLDKYRNYYHA
jgi:hypothetical protein